MRMVPLFQYLPERQNNWVELIKEETPVYQLKELSKSLQHEHLYVKREDLTDSLYGGNKVRNLEFLLGEAILQGSKKVMAVAPLGSNFIAALSAQSHKVGLPVEVHHFVPHCTTQMLKHAYFCKKVGAHLKVYGGGYFGSIVQSGLNYTARTLKDGNQVYQMPVGGSNVTGALGHVNAFLEMLEQARRGQVPLPEVLIVGAGTCGTMAGLLAANKLSNSNIRIIGVRCVDKIICNRFRIAKLANQILRYLKVAGQIRVADVDLRDRGVVNYGVPSEDSKLLAQTVGDAEGLTLDTTYTTKVVSYMAELIKQKGFANSKILYWHTFSPAAMQIPLDSKALALGADTLIPLLDFKGPPIC